MYTHLPCSTVPGEPANMANEGTTVSGGRTVLSSILQQSFRTQDCPFGAVRGRGRGREGGTVRSEREGQGYTML